MSFNNISSFLRNIFNLMIPHIKYFLTNFLNNIPFLLLLFNFHFRQVKFIHITAIFSLFTFYRTIIFLRRRRSRAQIDSFIILASTLGQINIKFRRLVSSCISILMERRMSDHSTYSSSIFKIISSPRGSIA